MILLFYHHMISSLCMIELPHPAQGRKGTTVRVNQPAEFEGRLGRCMVTDMVNVRKLTRYSVANFPAPSAEASAVNKGVSQQSVRFRAFLGVQIRAKGRQKRAKNDQKRRGFATEFIKTCQVAGLASSSDGPAAARVEIDRPRRCPRWVKVLRTRWLPAGEHHETVSLNRVPSAFLSFVGKPKRGEGYLLILRVLMAYFPREQTTMCSI